MRSRTGALIAFAIALSLSTTVLTTPASASVSTQVSFDFFYSNLSPHGSWVVSAQYGRVWQPGIYAPDWNPYYDGHWVYADVGWTWVSDYEWGAIPYHYGTWVLDPRVGWVWVPGYTWAPAWVVFRTGPDYIGWAPVAPSFAIGVSFANAVPVSGSFLFVTTRDFCAPRVRTIVVPERQARAIVSQTAIVNNLVVQNDIVVNRGPDVRVIETASQRKIPVTRVESLPRVAPFAQVRRQELTIAPNPGRRHVRAAEPVSTDQPVPQTKDVAQMSRGSSRGNPKALPPSDETVAPSGAPVRESPRAAPPAQAPRPQGSVETPKSSPAKSPKTFDKPAPQPQGSVEKPKSSPAKPPKTFDKTAQDPKKQEPKKQDPKKQKPKKQAPKKEEPSKQDEKQGGHGDAS